MSLRPREDNNMNSQDDSDDSVVLLSDPESEFVSGITSSKSHVTAQEYQAIGVPTIKESSSQFQLTRNDDEETLRSVSGSSSSSAPVAKKSTVRKRQGCRMSTGMLYKTAQSARRDPEDVEVVDLIDEDDDIDDDESSLEDSSVPDYIEIFEDDEEDVAYKDVTPDQMCCFVCEKTFKQKQQFIFHHRRHMAIEHFQCPTCLRGFVSLNMCFDHESQVHRKKSCVFSGDGQRLSTGSASTAGSSSGSSGTSRSSSGISSSCSGTNSGRSGINSCSSEILSTKSDVLEDSEDDDGWYDSGACGNRVLPSNYLVGYRGPSVSHFMECFEIEEKYRLKNRGVSPLVQQIKQMRALMRCPRLLEGADKE